MTNSKVPFIVIAIIVDDNFKEIGLRLFHGEEGKYNDVSTKCVADNMDRDINIYGARSDGLASYDMSWLSRIHAGTGKIYNSYDDYCKNVSNTAVELQNSQAIILDFSKTSENPITILNCIGQVTTIKNRGNNHQYLSNGYVAEEILKYYRKCQKKEKAVSLIKNVLGKSTALERKQEELKELNERINNDRGANKIVEQQEYYGQEQEIIKEFVTTLNEVAKPKETVEDVPKPTIRKVNMDVMLKYTAFTGNMKNKVVTWDLNKMLNYQKC